MNLAEKLQHLRKQNSLSQEQLAEKLNVSRQSISKWESEQSVPEIDKIIKISDIFGVTTDYLLKDSDKTPDSSVPITKDDNIDFPSRKLRLVVGTIGITFSILSIFIMWILSKVYPAPIVFFNTTTKKWLVGFDNFLWAHGLEGFYRLCWVIAILGIILLFFNRLKLLWEKIRVKFRYKSK